MSLLVHLGFEPVIEWATPATVAHAIIEGRDAALCGAVLGTQFRYILFGTQKDQLPNGRVKCAECLTRARTLGVE